MSKRQGSRKKTPFEIVTLILSLLAIGVIVFGLVGFGLTAGEGPPDLRTDLEALDENGAWELVVRNVGGASAERVIVEISSGEEMREVEFPFINKGDEERATVHFSTDAQPEAKVLHYSER